MFNSQEKQDELLEKNVFKGYKNGFFVDVGAHDGRSINNTLYFEEANNWTGICIEPISYIFAKLQENRKKCINLNCAISDTEGIQEFFLRESTMLSALKKGYDERHAKRFFPTNNRMTITKVPTRRLDSIFEEFNIKHVNYLSIDVEGGEFEVINSIDFDKVFIDVIDFENNFQDKSIPIVEYLKEKNYVLTKCQCNLDIMMINKNSQFYEPESN